MANRLYDLARIAFARGDISWKSGGDTFRAFLVDGAIYTPDTAVDEFLDDIPSAARYGTAGGQTIADAPEVVAADPAIADVAIGGVTYRLSVCDAADITFTAVPAAPALAYLVIFKAVTVDADSPLIAIMDAYTGLPVTPNGSDVPCVWDNGVSKIFTL